VTREAAALIRHSTLCCVPQVRDLRQSRRLAFVNRSKRLAGGQLGSFLRAPLADPHMLPFLTGFRNRHSLPLDHPGCGIVSLELLNRCLARLLNLQRFQEDLTTPGTVKLFESPGRAGGLLIIIIQPVRRASPRDRSAGNRTVPTRHPPLTVPGTPHPPENRLWTMGQTLDLTTPNPTGYKRVWSHRLEA
jgi:hypothetical protein